MVEASSVAQSHLDIESSIEKMADLDGSFKSRKSLI